MKILFDLDGLLTNFNKGVCEIHNVEDPYRKKENWGNYHIDKLIGIDAFEFWKPLEYDFWVNLEPMTDGLELLDFAENQVGAENICILSSPTFNKGCIPGKIDWIIQHLPKYQRRFLIGPRKEFCAHENALLIDDSDNNISSFKANNGKAILMPRKWNSKFDVEDAVGYVKNHMSFSNSQFQ